MQSSRICIERLLVTSRVTSLDLWAGNYDIANNVITETWKINRYQLGTGKYYSRHRAQQGIDIKSTQNILETERSLVKLEHSVRRKLRGWGTWGEFLQQQEESYRDELGSGGIISCLPTAIPSSGQLCLVLRSES